MGSRTPVMIGVDGMSAGEPFVLAYDTPVTIGRSRECEISMQKLRRYLELSEAERNASTVVNAVSRKHLRVCVSGTIAKLENLSPNGSWCDDARFDQVKHVDLAAGQVTLRVSPGESFVLMLMEQEQIERLLAKTQMYFPVPSTRVEPPRPPSGM
ncbi:MAG: FHA domain-containing protein [Planctomycetes bacterium]|nr:FHA domain-containing protein [Planctomycetota bacterium]